MKKQISVCLVLALLCALSIVPGMAEEAPTSPTEDFLNNLAATWDSLVRMGEEAEQNVQDWAANDLPDWAIGAGESIEAFFDKAGNWTEEAAANLQTFIEQNGPAVEAWLNQAGEDVRKAWDTLTNPESHTAEELESAYDTVTDSLNADAAQK